MERAGGDGDVRTRRWDDVEREGGALEVLVEGDSRLRNPYGAILVNPARHPHVRVGNARRLLDWLTSAEGQRRLGADSMAC